MALVLIAFTEQICDFIDLNDGVDIIRYTAITVIFNAIVACQTGMLAGFKRFKVMAYINVISGIATFISSVIFTYYWGLAGAILALAFSNLLNSILNAIGIEKNHQITRHSYACAAVNGRHDDAILYSYCIAGMFIFNFMLHRDVGFGETLQLR
jgi:Na+-driven multidrug efflux pump